MGKKKNDDAVDASAAAGIGGALEVAGAEAADGKEGKDGKDGKDGKEGKKKSKKDKEQLEALGGPAAPPPDPGPLAPWRLAICVAVSAAFTGQRLFDAAMSGVGIDGALVRSFGVAFALWIATGFVNRILLQAQLAIETERAEAAERERRAEREEHERLLAAELDSLSPKPWVETTGTESRPG
jgi:hypothetical protein